MIISLSSIYLTNHTLPNLTLPPCRTLKAVRMRLVIAQRLVDLLLRVEHEWPVLDDLLVEWQACYEVCMIISSIPSDA